MKKFIILFTSIALFGFLNVFNSLAQSNSKAKQHFDKREYALAIPEYEKELKKKKLSRSTQAVIEGHLGMSYYYLNKPKDAVSWINKSITHGYNTATDRKSVV